MHVITLTPVYSITSLGTSFPIYAFFIYAHVFRYTTMSQNKGLASFLDSGAIMYFQAG